MTVKDIPSELIDVRRIKNAVAGKYECRVLLCPEADGGYSAHSMNLPGVVSQGDSLEEALENISDAFCGAIGVYLELNSEIPWGAAEVDREKGSFERWILVDA